MKKPAALTIKVASPCCSDSARWTSVGQLGRDPPGLTAPAGQLGHHVIDPFFRASNDHRAATAIDDVQRGLAPHAGTAAEHDDLLTLEPCTHPLNPFIPDLFTCRAALTV
jgi:hypothetical protein